jgi:copper chaperone
MLGAMEATIQIKGMSCMHCVRAVEAVLNAIPGVRSVEVKVGEAKVVADDSVEEKTLKSAIQEEGYEIA